MNTSNVPLGPVGHILVDKESGVVGKCVHFFWPQSGRPTGFSVKLKTATGVIHEAPFFSVKKPSNSECDDF